MNNYESYEYLKLTHLMAICFGLPYTRRKIKEDFDPNGNIEHLAGGYLYSFDKRLIPVWMLYACLNAFVVYYNYLEGLWYVAGSFRTCLQESYCFALIELLNRNVGPSSNVVCSMFYGRWHKIAGLAGAERTLRFLDDTRDAAPAVRQGLSRAVRYVGPASLAAYASLTQLYMLVVSPAVVAAYWFNGMCQFTVYMLVFVQYYVLARGFGRVSDMVEALDVARDPASAGRSLTRLAGVYDELCTLTGHVNRAYAPEMLLQWVYNIIRVIMVIFRLLEIASTQDGPMASFTPYLMAQHFGELFIFVVHTMWLCTIGDRLSGESKRILASLEKLKLRNRYNMNMEIKKVLNIFYIRANIRNVTASIGGFIIFNMSLVRSVCSVLVTYVLVLIQFREQKGNSKPLYYIWN